MCCAIISDPWPTPVGVIGWGAVGSALAHALRAAGCDVLIGTRDVATQQSLAPEFDSADVAAVSTRAGLVFLTVPDTVLLQQAAAQPWRADQWVVHSAGALAAQAIAEAVAPGQPGAFHPLAAFTRPTAAAPAGSGWSQGIVVAIDGPQAVLTGLTALAQRLAAHPIIVPATARTAYHLGASLSSNMLVALVAMATQVWQDAGLDATLALPALAPLLESTVRNLRQRGLPDALTGPIARGDVATVARHLRWLDETAPDIAGAYRVLGRRALELARQQRRVDPAQLDAIGRLLESVTPESL